MRPLPCLARNGIAKPVQRFRTAIALLLATIWLPAVSCCLIDASGIVGHQDCCSRDHSHSTPGPGNCDQPCGALASASYFPQAGQVLILAPISSPLFDGLDIESSAPTAVRVSRDFPATAPPELTSRWQFSLRAAPPPRAPSFAS